MNSPIRGCVPYWFGMAALAVVCFFGPDAWALGQGPAGKRFGLGIVAGDPTGITGKHYVSSRLAASGIVAWSFVDEGATFIMDVTYDIGALPADTAAVKVPWYVGAGGKLVVDRGGKNRDQTVVGVRVPVGVAVQWNRHPVEVFVEVAPGIQVTPATEFDIGGGIGVRWYF